MLVFSSNESAVVTSVRSTFSAVSVLLVSAAVFVFVAVVASLTTDVVETFVTVLILGFVVVTAGVAIVVLISSEEVSVDAAKT